MVISNFGFFNIHKGNFYLPKLEKPYLHIWLTTYPKVEFHISKGGKTFTSTKGISICESWKSRFSIYNNLWLTTYPKAKFYISKEGKIQWKIDFQTWICSMQRQNAYVLNVDNEENLNLVACGKFLMIYPCLVDIFVP